MDSPSTTSRGTVLVGTLYCFSKMSRVSVYITYTNPNDNTLVVTLRSKLRTRRRFHCTIENEGSVLCGGPMKLQYVLRCYVVKTRWDSKCPLSYSLLLTLIHLNTSSNYSKQIDIFVNVFGMSCSGLFRAVVHFKNLPPTSYI